MHTADWAPEMRLRNAAGKRVPYNECVDWFSLGCILYEFLRGMSPFRTERAIEWCADTIQDKVHANFIKVSLFFVAVIIALCRQCSYYQ